MQVFVSSAQANCAGKVYECVCSFARANVRAVHVRSLEGKLPLSALRDRLGREEHALGRGAHLCETTQCTKGQVRTGTRGSPWKGWDGAQTPHRSFRAEWFAVASCFERVMLFERMMLFERVLFFERGTRALAHRKCAVVKAAVLEVFQGDAELFEPRKGLALESCSFCGGVGHSKHLIQFFFKEKYWLR